MLVVGLTSGCYVIPTDEYRENLTIDEAQSLVSFSICVPSYIPPNSISEPNIIYLNDAVNVPEERYIRLQYKSKEDQNKLFEVFQVFTNEEGMKSHYPEPIINNLREGAKVGLLYWLLDPKILLDLDMKDLMKNTFIEASVHQTNQVVWWLFEIIDPGDYHSTMTRWFVNQVEYRVLSVLPVEEIMTITESMMKCANP